MGLLKGQARGSQASWDIGAARVRGRDASVAMMRWWCIVLAVQLTEVMMLIRGLKTRERCDGHKGYSGGCDGCGYTILSSAPVSRWVEELHLQYNR